MKIQLKYGKGSIDCQIDDSLHINHLEPAGQVPLPSLREALISSLESPVKADPLSELVKPGYKILIVVPDKTRQCLLDKTVPLLLNYLEELRISRENITLIFANGTHTGQIEADARRLLGDYIVDTVRVVQHNSKDTNSLAHIGTTSRGTEILLNKQVLGADLIITLGGILHHYFAGFGGGPKLLVPGIAGYKTARKNHSLTIDDSGNFNQLCRDGNLDANPVYEDIIEAIRMLEHVFSINLVIDMNDNVVHIASGDPVAAHRYACSHAARTFEVPVQRQADVVLVSAGGAPRDGTFIQSHKSIHHAFHAVKPGGMIVAAAQCGDGIGSDTFLDWFDIAFRNLGQALQESYSLNGHTALSLRNKLRSIALMLVSDLPRDIVTRLGIIPAESLYRAVDRVTGSCNDSSLIYVIPNGSLTLPVFGTYSTQSNI